MQEITWPASMQSCWNKRKCLHKKRVQIPQDWFGTPTWPPFYCFGTPIWPPWRHVKTLYSLEGQLRMRPHPPRLSAPLLSRKIRQFSLSDSKMPRGYLAPKECALLVGRKVASLILPVFFSISFQHFILLWKRGCLFLCFWLVSEWDLVSLPSPRGLRWGDG